MGINYPYHEAVRLYTRTGDGGTTSLRDGRRLRKDDLRVAVLGELDELNSCLGVALSFLRRERLAGQLRRIQKDLLEAGAAVASPRSRLDPKAVLRLEAEIDRLAASLPPLRKFVCPGDSRAGAFLHLARSVCRRAERAACRTPARGVAPYLNRLSDYLFAAARLADR